MAQRKQLTWSELRVGIFVLFGLVILALAILWVTGVGFFGPKYQLRAYVSEAEDVQAGAPVTLDGVNVGNIQSIHLTPHPQDRQHAVTMVMQISKKYQRDIRTDSRASLITAGLLGDRYLNITRGLTGSVIPDNGIVPSEEVPDIKQVVQRGADVMQKLSVLTDDVTSMITNVQNGKGSIGKFMNDPSLYNHLDATAAKFDDMATSIQEGKGTAGKLIASDELYNKFDDTVTKADGIMTAVQQQKGTIGKMIYDPAMANDIEGAAHKTNALLSGVQEGKGSLGKFVEDDALYDNLRDTSANLRDVTGKLNNGQGTMGKFFTDPQLYDNLTGLTGDMRVLMNDFRKNPKKFLRIKLGIF